MDPQNRPDVEETPGSPAESTVVPGSPQSPETLPSPEKDEKALVVFQWAAAADP